MGEFEMLIQSNRDLIAFAIVVWAVVSVIKAILR